MSWVLFPLYGLKLTEPDAWVNEPLFDDSTLVSREALRNYLKKDTQVHPNAIPLLSHEKLSKILGPEKITSFGMPVDQLVEIEPPTYIAVRDRLDPHRNARRATEIRALLSASLALRGPRLQTFATTPTQIAWFLTPREITLRGGAIAPQARIAPTFNEHILITTLAVSQEDIRKSLKDGSLIPNNKGWLWDIHSAHPVVQLFLGKINTFQRRLLNTAIQIQEAGCAITYAAQIQGAVAAMEVLLKPDSFNELRKSLEAFFPGGDQSEKARRLLSARNRITHEGAGRGEDEQNKDVARDAIIFAWTMLDIGTAFEKGGATTTFDDYVKMLVAARDLDEKLGRFSTQSPGYQGALRERMPEFIQYLTLRRDPK